MRDAYHCRILTPAKHRFEAELSKFTFEEPKHPIFRNVDGKLYTRETIRQGLVDHFDHPVLFQKSIENAFGWVARQRGTSPLEAQPDVTLVDIGSQGFLTKAVEDIQLPLKYTKVVINS